MKILVSKSTKGQKPTNKEDHIRYFIWKCKLQHLAWSHKKREAYKNIIMFKYIINLLSDFVT